MEWHSRRGHGLTSRVPSETVGHRCLSGLDVSLNIKFVGVEHGCTEGSILGQSAAEGVAAIFATPLGAGGFAPNPGVLRGQAAAAAGSHKELIFYF